MKLMLDTNVCIYLINVKEFGKVPGLRIEDWA